MRTLKRSTGWRAGLGDFSDCLLAGLLVALASVPVVTAAPALTAGCRILDRARHDVGAPLWTTFWADFREAARGGVLFGLGCLAAVVVFAVDLEVVASMPAAGVLKPALWVLVVAGVVVAVRTCEVMATGSPAWRRAAGAAAREAAVVGPAWRREFGAAAREAAVVGPAWRREFGAAAREAAAGGPAWRRAAGTAAREAAVVGPAWRPAFVAAARETAGSPGRSLLLAAAVGLAVLLVWMLPILALVVAGPLALAAVATGGRR
ncbi:DUF624 domain-containing protein [Amycolatopsis sp. A133]|uniref:DUF624 domain-containing protein n=1 Tax=Amycolatopsis sp. A133 TaxID=3064472 RepID=UPI0027E9E519|nr:DUF624 domain-containing protein [Amycolatopsis sp. A133]MDQ7804767.1 DUF624 domain-containing protein [Amycolatopsis sp. A133]